MHNDELDHRIVDLLRQDGRMPNVMVAKRLGVSEATVRKRIARLLGHGLKIVAVGHEDGQEIDRLLRLRARQAKQDAVARRLASLGAIDRVFVTTGRFDVVAHARFRSAQAHGRVIAGLRADPDIERVESDVILDVVASSPIDVRVHAELKPLVDSLASASDIEDLLRVAFDEAAARFGADRFAVHLLDNGVPLYAGSRHLSAEYLLDSSQAVFKAGCEDAPVPLALRHGRSLAVVDAQSDPTMSAMHQAAVAEGLTSVWVLLMRSGVELVGAFNLYYDEPTEPDDRFEAAQLFADAVGSAIQDLRHQSTIESATSR